MLLKIVCMIRVTCWSRCNPLRHDICRIHGLFAFAKTSTFMLSRRRFLGFASNGRPESPKPSLGVKLRKRNRDHLYVGFSSSANADPNATNVSSPPCQDLGAELSEWSLTGAGPEIARGRNGCAKALAAIASGACAVIIRKKDDYLSQRTVTKETLPKATRK